MKTLNKILSLGALSLAAVACNDLDTAPLGNTITSQQKGEVIAGNPDMAEASTQAIPTMLKQFGNILGTSQHMDFGYPSIMLGLDSRSTDMMSYVIGYNWYSEDVNYSDNKPNSRMTREIWGTMFNQIKSCNDVAVTINRNTTDPQLMYFLAQALATRANAYFVLAQAYQFTYVGHEDAPCVPLLTDENLNEVAVNGAPRATVKEVYDQILADLDKAIELLEKTHNINPSTREEKGFYYVTSARGLRARVNLVMNRWAEAAADAQYAINNSTATPYSRAEVSKPTFWDASDHSWMVAVIVNEGDRVVTTGICNWPSMACSFNEGGYVAVGAGRYGNKAMVDAIPTTDVRKGWWIVDQKSPNLNAAQLKYILGTFNSETASADYVNVKFDNYQSNTKANAANDIPMMRIEEMYLILAEAQAMAGNPGTGAQTLTSFVKQYRDPNYQCTAATAAEVQEAVYQQRRIELWGEGMAYFDLMRLKKPVDRRGGGFEATTCFNIPAESPILIYQIPQTEMEGNPAIGDNNPEAPVPTPVKDEL